MPTAKKEKPERVQETLKLDDQVKVDGVPSLDLENIDTAQLLAAILQSNINLQERLVSAEEKRQLQTEKDEKKREELTRSLDAKAREKFNNALAKFQKEEMVEVVGEEYLKEFFGRNIKFSINGVVFEIPLNGQKHKLPKSAHNKMQKLIRARMNQTKIKEAEQYDGQLFRPAE